jgi:hypothetical protein
MIALLLDGLGILAPSGSGCGAWRLGLMREVEA